MKAIPSPREQTVTGLPQEEAELEEVHHEIVNPVTTKPRPIKKFQAGAISATIWENHHSDKSYRTVSFDRTYQDKNGEWKRSNSLRATDLPKAVIVLKKAYEFLVLRDYSGNPAHV